MLGGECDKRKEGRTALSTLATDHISPTQFSGSFLMSHAHMHTDAHATNKNDKKKSGNRNTREGVRRLRPDRCVVAPTDM